jgi:hypothetical protein
MKYYRFFIIFTLLITTFFSFDNTVFSASTLFFTKPTFVSEGDRVTVFVRVRATDEPINAISGVITFPDNLLRPISVSKESSIISLWTGEPKINRGRISFEGVILNPGFNGSNGLVLRIIFEARSIGIASLNFSEGAILANDGFGSNVLARLESSTLRINTPSLKPNIPPTTQVVVDQTISLDKKIAKLPVILEFSSNILSNEKLYLKGQGEPNTLTKIVFKDVSVKSLGEELLTRLQNKKIKPDSVLVKNDEEGAFEYTSARNLVAGVYNATPFLVDTEQNIEKPGLGTQILVNDSEIVKNLIVFINVLGLFIPIVILCVIIYFIPWYSWIRMRILKKKLGLEEEKIELTGINLAKQENLLNQNINDKKQD